MANEVDLSTIDRALKIVPFDGKIETWPRWRARFEAMAQVKGFWMALKKKGNLPQDPEDYDTGMSAEQKAAAERAIKMNSIAYSTLILSVEGDPGFGRVDSARTEHYPTGIAYLAWERLLEEYEPNDHMSKVELRQMFMSTKFEKQDEDPEMFFTRLDQVRQRYENNGMTLDDTEMLTQLVAVAPKEYQNVLTNYMMYNEDVKIQEIRKTLKHHYRALKISSKEDQTDNEVALAGFGFKGRCKKCGVFGHKAAKCPEKKKGNNGPDKKENKIKIKGKCFNCGKEGHRAVDCWHKEENKDKRPRNFVAREISMADNSTADVPVIALMAHESPMPSEMTECVLSAGTTASVNKVQHRVNVWIADSGATSHMTFSKDGMKNLKEDTTGVVIEDGCTMKRKKLR